MRESRPSVRFGLGLWADRNDDCCTLRLGLGGTLGCCQLLRFAPRSFLGCASGCGPLFGGSPGRGLLFGSTLGSCSFFGGALSCGLLFGGSPGRCLLFGSALGCGLLFGGPIGRGSFLGCASGCCLFLGCASGCGLLFGGSPRCGLLFGCALGSCSFFGGPLGRGSFLGCALGCCLLHGRALRGGLLLGCALGGGSHLRLASRLDLGGAQCRDLFLGLARPLVLGSTLGTRVCLLGVDRVALRKCLAFVRQAYRYVAVPTLPEHVRMVRPKP